MFEISPFKAGLALGILFAAWHSCWALLVYLGWAQPVIDILFWLHFIKPVYVIQPFEVRIAMYLVAVTASIGFGLGLVFSLIWNRFQLR